MWLLVALVLGVLLISRAQAAGGLAAVPFRAEILRAASAARVDACLLAAVVAVESSFDPRAVNPSDPSYGLGQLLLSTARELRPGIELGDPLNPRPGQLFHPQTNLDLAAEYLAQLRDRFSIPLPGRVDAYNIGPGAYRRGVRNEVYLRRVLDRMRVFC